MKIHNRISFFFVIMLTGMVFLASCGTANEAAPELPSSDPDLIEDSGEEIGSLPQQDAQPVEDEPQVSDEEIQAAIRADWNNSPHAAAYVLYKTNENNSCARCHSPINWQPTMDDLPESCFSCKFELEDPDPLVAEQDWLNIPCMVCHEVGKKDKVEPEYKWLEIAQLEEYAEVESATDLCQKCHPTEAFEDHGGIQDLGAHQDLACTSCHDAHSTQASCMDAGCHESVMDGGFPGHTEDHLDLACVACHDASGMKLGFREEDDLFTTMATVLIEEGENIFFFPSHNLQLESSCDDCHFAGNPWNIAESVEQ
jgi:hypothetical protein